MMNLLRYQERAMSTVLFQYWRCNKDVGHINSLPPSFAFMRRCIGSALFQTMDKPLSKPMPEKCQLEPYEQTQWDFKKNTKLFIRKNASQISTAKCRPFCPGREEFTRSFLFDRVTGIVVVLLLSMQTNSGIFFSLNVHRRCQFFNSGNVIMVIYRHRNSYTTLDLISALLKWSVYEV